MSEFKFACPVCGQHITADSSATGSQLDCPTCFRKIIVPRGGSSTESKFILSASEANKPRPILPGSTTKAQAPGRARSLPAVLFVALFLVCIAAGATLFLYRDKIFNHSSPDGNTSDDQLLAVSTNELPWTLDLTDAAIPEGTVNGRIGHRDFVSERALLQGGMLSLRMHPNKPGDTSINIYLFARQAAELSGKTAIVTTNNIRSPRVTLRWKEGEKNITVPFTNGYAMKLEFDALNGNHLPGRIYICLPDEAHSCVAGSFNAEVKKPSAPKPKSTKTN